MIFNVPRAGQMMFSVFAIWRIVSAKRRTGILTIGTTLTKSFAFGSMTGPLTIDLLLLCFVASMLHCFDVSMLKCPRRNK